MSRARDIADLAGAADAGTVTGTNLIINGDMAVAQRGTSFTSQTGNGYFIDRFKVVQADDATWTYSQETDAPSGFANSFKALVTTVDGTNDASDYQFIRYSFEGQDLQQLKKGTSDAESVTLSFWVKCSNAGTFISELNDTDNDRTISKSYTINSADTWEYKTVTFDGDTTGSLDNDNAESLRVHWWYGAGNDWTSGTLATSWQARTNADRAVGSTVNIPTTSGGYFQITGVKLEVGTTATDFLHESYGENLAKCQRYFTTWEAIWAGVAEGSGYHQSALVSFPVHMRATPSVARTDGTNTTRYPSSAFGGSYVNNTSFAAFITAQSSGGNETWQAIGTANAEL